MFDTKSNKAICVLPWVHEFKGVTGETKPCCLAKQFTPTEDQAKVRQMMLLGKKPDVCQTCYIQETESGWSPRIKETKDWIKKFGSPNIENPQLEFIDLRFDATCNLKCKTCGPYASTLWQKEKGVSYPKNTNTKLYFQKIDKKKLKKVYMAGGEPTYIKEYLSFLEEIYEVNKECEIIVNTNLKKLPNAWKNLLTKFPNITVVCSCDAIKDLASYVRYPLGWSEFQENVEFVSKNVNFLQFNLVASNLTVHRLYETCSWMKNYSKNINLSILSEPEIFSEKSVPISMRKLYIQSLEKIKKFPVNIHYVTQFKTELNYLLKKYSESAYDPVLHDQLRTEIQEQDSHRHLKLGDVDTFLHSWIYG